MTKDQFAQLGWLRYSLDRLGGIRDESKLLAAILTTDTPEWVKDKTREKFNAVTKRMLERAKRD